MDRPDQELLYDLIVVDNAQMTFPAVEGSIRVIGCLVMFDPALGGPEDRKEPIAMPEHRIHEILYKRPLPPKQEPARIEPT